MPQYSITFIPTQPGVRSATLTIHNNDLDEDPYTFAIQGTRSLYSLVLPLAVR